MTRSKAKEVLLTRREKDGSVKWEPLVNFYVHLTGEWTAFSRLSEERTTASLIEQLSPDCLKCENSSSLATSSSVKQAPAVLLFVQMLII